MDDLLVDLTNKPAGAVNNSEDPASEMVSPVNAISEELGHIRRLLEAYIDITLDSGQKERLLSELAKLR